jgi:nucleoside-diphosphate-sugar epimerase
MTILVVGASGATGQHLVAQLLKQGQHVKAVVRSAEKFIDILRNQRSATKEKEQVYLNGLQSEFLANRQKLQTLIEVNRRNYESVKTILRILDNGTKPPNEKQLSQLLFDAFAYEIAYNPNNSPLD